MADVVIGIDQSLTAAGIVAIDVDTAKVVHSTVIRSKPGPDRYTKLYEGYMSFFILIDHTLGHTVRQIIRENHAFGSEYGREAMGAAAAICDMAIWDHFKRGSPSAVIQQLKKFAGNGKMKKDEVRLAVYKKWDQEFKSNDEVDAYVLARIARGLYVDPSTVNHLAYEREVLDKIKDNEWPPQTSKSSRPEKSPSSGSSPTPALRRLRRPSPTPSTTTGRSSSGPSGRVRSTRR